MSEQSKTLEVNITLMVYYSRIPKDLNKSDIVLFCYLYSCTNNYIIKKYEKNSYLIGIYLHNN